MFGIDQAENLAFVVLMGVDQTEDGGIELSVQVPKISGSRGNGEDSGCLLYTSCPSRS